METLENLEKINNTHTKGIIDFILPYINDLLNLCFLSFSTFTIALFLNWLDPLKGSAPDYLFQLNIIVDNPYMLRIKYRTHTRYDYIQ